MKKEIKKEGYRLLHPKLTFLLTSVDKKGKANVMSLAWATPLSMEPFLVGIAVGKESQTAKNINETKEFVLNVPDVKLLHPIWTCGRKSGRAIDKFKTAKLTKEKARFVKPPVIKECIGHIECRVKEKIDAAECFLFIGEVIHCTADTYLYRRYWQEKARVVLHLGGKNFATTKKIRDD